MAKKIDYDIWSKDELVKEIRRIKETTYGLVWHRDLPEEKIDILINPDARTPNEMFPNEMAGKPFPVLKEVKGKAIESDKSKLVNLLIEGDNYHSLAVLNFTHHEAIDFIYIDPPYNTGNRNWKYNNDFVDKEDPFRHSKFISFLHKRLKLAKNLLKETGIICLTIDDHEIFPVGMLMDEIFGEENRLGVITIAHNPRGRSDDKFFATAHEYALFYAKDVNLAQILKLDLNEEQIKAFNLEDKISKYRLLPLRRSGSNSLRTARRNLYYSIYFNPKTGEKTVSNPNDKSFIEILPVDSKGIERVWRWGKETLSKTIDSEIVIKESKGKFSVFAKDRIKNGRRLKTYWVDPKYDASSHGTILLESILGKNKAFDYPKSIFALIDTLKIVVGDNKNACVLDFFAGSGTTGHAVLELNKEDDGQRNFILCTNDENGICRDVCYPRIKKVISGYKNQKGEKIKELGGNLKYFVTDFVEAEPTDKNKRKLVKESTDMLCILENAFELVQETPEFKIFKNTDKYVGVIFYEEAIEDYKKAIKKINGHFNTYVFSMGDDPHTKKFTDVKSKVTLCAIPEIILKVYREIFK